MTARDELAADDVCPECLSAGPVSGEPSRAAERVAKVAHKPWQERWVVDIGENAVSGDGWASASIDHGWFVQGDQRQRYGLVRSELA